jgi:hypothetical protein
MSEMMREHMNHCSWGKMGPEDRQRLRPEKQAEV